MSEMLVFLPLLNYLVYTVVSREEPCGSGLEHDHWVDDSGSCIASLAQRCPPSPLTNQPENKENAVVLFKILLKSMQRNIWM